MHSYQTDQINVDILSSLNRITSRLQQIGTVSAHKPKEEGVQCKGQHLLRDSKYWPCIAAPTLISEDFKEKKALLRSYAQLFVLRYNINFRSSKKEDLIQKKKKSNKSEEQESEDESESDEDNEQLNISKDPTPTPDVNKYKLVSDLPLYGWSRTKCWNESPQQYEHRLGPQWGRNHPIVRIRLDSLIPQQDADISISHIKWVEDHQLQNNIVVPGVTYVECVFSCGEQLFRSGKAFWFRDVKFLNAFYMNKGEVVNVNISCSPIQKEGVVAR
ncbi:MAG: hypothetical protein EZS28_036872, partial [Streblomastix strix]